MAATDETLKNTDGGQWIVNSEERTNREWTGISDATLPMAIVPRSVQHSRHNDRLPGFIDFVNDTVWKAVGITPADVLARMFPGVEERVFRKGVPQADYFLHEPGSKSGLPAFIPIGGFGNVLFDFGSDDHPPAHLAGRERNLAFMASRGTAEPGS